MIREVIICPNPFKKEFQLNKAIPKKSDEKSKEMHFLLLFFNQSYCFFDFSGEVDAPNNLSILTSCIK